MMSDNLIYLKYEDEKRIKHLKVKANHSEKYYEQFANIYFDLIGCSKSVAEIKARYIKWMDFTNFVKSNSKYGIFALSHKMPTYLRNIPHDFDHTTLWRNHNDRWPLFILTEPYRLPNEEDLKNWDILCEKHNLKYKIYDPSNLSLWVPNRTYMIFWWCPKYFDLENNSKIMTHETSEEINKYLV